MTIVNTGNYVPKALRVGESGGVVTTQGYVEKNVKEGSQWTASSYFTGVTNGETLDVIVETGALPIIIKAQDVNFTGEVLQIDWYEGGDYSGGTDITSSIFNQNTASTNTPLVKLYSVAPTDANAGNYSPDNASKPMITTLGTKIQPTITLLGNESQIGGRDLVTPRITGLDLILKPNTRFLFRRTALNSTTQDIVGFSTWYEGEYTL